MPCVDADALQILNSSLLQAATLTTALKLPHYLLNFSKEF